MNSGIVVVEVGLVMQETMQVVLLRNRIPGPVGVLKVAEEDRCFAVAVGVVSPDVVIPLRAPPFGEASPLKPRMELTGVCLLYTSPSPRDRQKSRMPSSA